MPALISIVQSTSIHFITDGCGPQTEGGLLKPANRTLALVTANTMLAVIGPSAILHAAQSEFARSQSFDDVLTQDALHCLAGRTGSIDAAWTLYLAGWRRSLLKWCAYAVSNRPGPDAKAFTARQLPTLFIYPQSRHLMALSAQVAGRYADDVRPGEVGLRLMQAMRAEGGPSRVGGLCWLSTVSGLGVRSSVLAEWPEDFSAA